MEPLATYFLCLVKAGGRSKVKLKSKESETQTQRERFASPVKDSGSKEAGHRSSERPEPQTEFNLHKFHVEMQRQQEKQHRSEMVIQKLTRILSDNTVT